MVIMIVPQDGIVDLGFCRILQHLVLLFRFGTHVRFKRLDILLDPRFDALKQAYAISVLPVSVFFSHCHPLLSSRSGGCPHPPGRAKLGSSAIPAEMRRHREIGSASPSGPCTAWRHPPGSV